MSPLTLHQEFSVREDTAGRFCLNDLHQAAGGEPKHRPNQWLRSQQTQDLIREIGSVLTAQKWAVKTGRKGRDADEGLTAQKRAVKPGRLGHASAAPDVSADPVHTIEGRHGGGTYACRELVYAYAMWISPAFHLRVIRAFDALVSGRPLLPGESPASSAAASQAQAAREIASAYREVGEVLNGLPLVIQQAAAAEIRAKTGIDLPVPPPPTSPRAQDALVRAPDVIQRFWSAVEALEAKGVCVNHYPLDAHAIAVNLPVVAALAAKHGVPIPDLYDLRIATRCEYEGFPQFLIDKVIHSQPSGRSVRVRIFRRRP